LDEKETTFSLKLYDGLIELFKGDAIPVFDKARV